MFVARAMLRRPDLLVLDEPTSGVDVRTRHEVLHLLAELQTDGLSIVLTTHDLNGIAAHLPRLVCINGRVVGRRNTVRGDDAGRLEATYGAPMEILEHGGMPVVVDRPALRSTAGDQLMETLLEPFQYEFFRNGRDGRGAHRSALRADRDVRRPPRHELHRARVVARHLRRLPRPA